MKQFLYLAALCSLCLLLTGCPARPVADKTVSTSSSYTVTDDSGYTMLLADKP